MSWLARASCATYPPEWWDDLEELGTGITEEQEQAALICANCPVADECYADAVAMGGRQLTIRAGRFMARAHRPLVLRPQKKAPQGRWTSTSLKPCGTRPAYERHRRRGEEPCAPCREAKRRHADMIRRQRLTRERSKRQAEAQNGPPCGCGCGLRVRSRRKGGEWCRFRRGHALRSPERYALSQSGPGPDCACGCGEKVGMPSAGVWSRYRPGHNMRPKVSA